MGIVVLLFVLEYYIVPWTAVLGLRVFNSLHPPLNPSFPMPGVLHSLSFSLLSWGLQPLSQPVTKLMPWYGLIPIYLSSSLPPSPRHQASINTQQRTSLQNLTPQKPIWKQETLCLTQTTCTTWNPNKETTRLHCSVGHSICAHPPQVTRAVVM